jgi:prepilin-type N-terminal cleavage/methylation domain-containing protein
MMVSRKQQGFTIIELMIATTIFSLILTMCMAGIMQITKMYYRATTQAKTREVARSIIDEIAETIRFSNQEIQIVGSVDGPQVDPASSNPDSAHFCLGAKRYSYAIDRQVSRSPSQSVGSKQQKHALWVDSSDCSGPADLEADTPSVGGKDLVPENMRLYDLRIELRDPVQRTYFVSVGVAYGDDDLLRVKQDNQDVLTCEGAFVGVEFCATTTLSVTVQKRL